MLNNRKPAEETKLKGVVLAADEDEIALGNFTELANWVPADIDHLKKKRGVQAFTSSAVVPSAPILGCGGKCPADTVPEIQNIPVVHEYNFQSGSGIGTNVAGNVDYIVPGETTQFRAIRCVRSGFGQDYPYLAGTEYLICTDGTTVATTDYIPLNGSIDRFNFPGQDAQSGKMGQSDEMCYALIGWAWSVALGYSVTQGMMYFSHNDNTSYFLASTGMSGGTSGFGQWVKDGSNFYTANSSGNIYKFAVSSPGQTFSNSLTGTGYNYLHICKSDSYLWLFSDDSTSFHVHKHSLSDLSLIQTYHLTDMEGSLKICGMCATSDDLLWFISKNDVGSGGAFWIYQPSIDTVTQLDTTQSEDNLISGNPTASSLMFESGYLYSTYNGTASIKFSMYKWGAVYCPGTTVPIGLP